MHVTSVDQVRAYTLKKEGTRGVEVKYLLHKGVGAKRIQLRLFTIDVGGIHPLRNMYTNMKFTYCMGKCLSEEEVRKC